MNGHTHARTHTYTGSKERAREGGEKSKNNRWRIVVTAIIPDKLDKPEGNGIRIMAFRYRLSRLSLIDNLNLTFTAVRPRCIAANRLPLNLSILVHPLENLGTPPYPGDNFELFPRAIHVHAAMDEVDVRLINGYKTRRILRELSVKFSTTGGNCEHSAFTGTVHYRLPSFTSGPALFFKLERFITGRVLL